MYTVESIERLEDLIDIRDVLDQILDIEVNEDNEYLCPFCGSNHFLVDIEIQTCGCIKCQFIGNAIPLIMLVDEVSFEKAVETLADYYKFDLKECDEISGTCGKCKDKEECPRCQTYKDIIADLTKRLHKLLIDKMS